MEEILVSWLKEYGYIILFLWCMLEGETALVMAGIFSHTGDMNFFLAILIASLGGFAGDQLYFYIGRYNKAKIHKKLKKQRRKFALAHILMKKHGSWIIFIQRYLYGLRTILPISIGLTRYSARKFALINLISAFCWASITIIPAFLFGEQILIFIEKVKEYWYFAIPLFIIVFLMLFLALRRFQNNILERKKNENYIRK